MYLRNYSTVVLRDILQRNNGTDQAMLQKIILFLCSNIGIIDFLLNDTLV